MLVSLPPSRTFMAVQIDDDAKLILTVLNEAPRNDFVEAADIAAKTGLAPERVNDATAILVEAGLVEWLQVMGTAPFDFADAMITPQGRRALQASAAARAELRTDKTGEPQVRLFISHASDDAELALRIVVLLSTALNLPASAIRCTSVDGYRLPGGANTDQQLRREVHESETFVGIVSHSSLRSMYVLFELGARWGAGRSLIPLLSAGLSPSVISGPLSGLNALRADNSSQLHQLVDDVGRELGIKPQSPAVFDRSLREVLNVPPTEKPERPEQVSSSTIADGADDVMKLLAEEEGLSAEEIGRVLGLSTTKAKYILDQLEDRKFVGSVRSVGSSSEYHLQKAGRNYVVNAGLVP